MRWPLISVDDLEPADLWEILAAADEYRTRTPRTGQYKGLIAGLVFFDSSLRTRVGFHAAASRLGADVVEVLRARENTLSSGESWHDTIRVVAGYTDAIVGRHLGEFGALPVEGVAFVSGGDRSTESEHPTQALIDLYAIRRWSAAENPNVVILGDPTMRAPRSLIKLLVTKTECRVTIVTDSRFLTARTGIGGVAVARDVPEDCEVLYVTGMHHESLPLADRERLIVTPETLSALPHDAVVLSPLPVIDEISKDARLDSRVRMFEQSDDALFVRMAVLARAFEQSRRRWTALPD